MTEVQKEFEELVCALQKNMNKMSACSLQKQFDDLAEALQNGNVAVFKNILEGPNGEAFLSWETNKLVDKDMTPMMIACRYCDDVETFQSFFDCIRNIGGDNLLRFELSKNDRASFYSVLLMRDSAVILFFLRTFLRIGEDFLKFQLSFTTVLLCRKNKPVSLLHDRATANRDINGEEVFRDVFNIIAYYTLKFFPYTNENYQSSLQEFQFFNRKFPHMHFSPSLILDFENKAKEEERWYMLAKQTVKQEARAEEEEMASRVNLESKLRIVQRELELERRAHENEAKAHEVTREQLRLSLQQQKTLTDLLAQQSAGSRRQRDED